MSEAEADAQAEEIFNQIKAASSDIKELEHGALLQLNSDIRIATPEDEIALTYLANQFPDDYVSEEEKKAKVNPPEPTPAQRIAQEKKDMVDYAKLVATEAESYQQKLKDEEKAK